MSRGFCPGSFHFWSKSWYHLTVQSPQSFNSQGIAAFLLTPLLEEEYASVPIPNITKGVKLCQTGSKTMTMEGAKFMVSIINLHTFITDVVIEEENITFTDALELLAEKYYWSRSVSNFSGKLARESLRYTEAVELADVLGYDVVWVKREKKGGKSGDKS